MLWLARRGLHEAEEACCDAWVAWTFPGSSAEYAAALVDAIEYAGRAGGAGSVAALGSGIGGFRSLKRRLVMISNGTTRATTGRLGGAAVWLASLVLPLSYGYAQQSGNAPATHPSPAQWRRMRNSMPRRWRSSKRDMPSVVTDDVGFVDAVQFFHDVSGLEFVVVWDQVNAAGIGKNAPVRLSLQKATLSEAIDKLLVSAAGKPGVLAYTVDRGNIVIARLIGQQRSPSEEVERGAGRHFKACNGGIWRRWILIPRKSNGNLMAKRTRRIRRNGERLAVSAERLERRALLSATGAVAGVTLINADTDAPVPGVALAPGTTIDLGAVGHRLNIPPTLRGGISRQRRFNYDGDPNYNVENYAPYDIGGDARGGRDYLPWLPTVGTHTLVVTPYPEQGATGQAGLPYLLLFNVIDTSTPASPINVNAGGGAYTDVSGHTFASDSSFVAGPSLQ